jgi:protein-L-isoaspartate(D-aspartate) O-methyltransferase
MIDYTNFDSDKANLVNGLILKGIKSEKVLEAIAKVDRHRFVQQAFIPRAYEDTALPIGSNQTISQPYTVAIMTECLRVKEGSKILEIGTGSGYQAAILAEMGAKVYSIERIPELLLEAQKTLEKLKYTVVCKIGDGSIGWSEYAPYDGIIITAAAPEAPKSLLDQLAEGGKLVVPIGTLDAQDIHIITKHGKNFYTDIKQGFRFVPLIGKEGWTFTK